MLYFKISIGNLYDQKLFIQGTYVNKCRKNAIVTETIYYIQLQNIIKLIILQFNTITAAVLKCVINKRNKGQKIKGGNLLRNKE